MYKKFSATLSIVRGHWRDVVKGSVLTWVLMGTWAVIEAAWSSLPSWGLWAGGALTLGCLGGYVAGLIAHLQHTSLTDPLTGLPNRRGFYQYVERFLGLTRRYGQPLSLVLIDLDEFKAVNDTWGHAVGDRVLQEVGDILAYMIGKEGLAARMGGDEFALVLPKTPGYRARDLARRLQDQIRDQCGMGVSAGVAAYPTDGQTVELLLKAADRALYHQKAR